MFKKCIKNFYIVSFIVFNVQNLQSFWCCKDDATVDTRLKPSQNNNKSKSSSTKVIVQPQQNNEQIISSQKQSNSLSRTDSYMPSDFTRMIDQPQNNQKKSAQVSKDALTSSILPNQEFSPSHDVVQNNSSNQIVPIQDQRIHEDQDINKSTQRSSFEEELTSYDQYLANHKKHNDETGYSPKVTQQEQVDGIGYSPRNSKQVIASEFICTLAQEASGNNNSNNPQKSSAATAISPANQNQIVDNRFHAFFSMSSINSSSTEQNSNYSLFNVQTNNSTPKKKSSFGIVTTYNNEAEHMNPNTNKSINESLRTNSNFEVYDCPAIRNVHFSSTNSSQHSNFKTNPQNDTNTNGQETNPMPHQVNTPESSQG